MTSYKKESNSYQSKITSVLQLLWSQYSLTFLILETEHEIKNIELRI